MGSRKETYHSECTNHGILHILVRFIHKFRNHIPAFPSNSVELGIWKPARYVFYLKTVKNNKQRTSLYKPEWGPQEMLQV